MCAPPLLSLPSEFQMISVTFPSATSIFTLEGSRWILRTIPSRQVCSWVRGLCLHALLLHDLNHSEAPFA